MRRAIVGTLGLTLTAGFLVALGTTAQAQPDDGHTPPTTKPQSAAVDDLPDPLEDKRRELRKSALSDVLSGRRETVRKNGSTVVKVGTKTAPMTKAEAKRAKAGKAVKPREVDQYVELAREKTDKIFVVLAEFGNERHPTTPTRTPTRTPPVRPTFDGPLHNAIPEPDRSKDNSTVWQADYSADYYRNLYFGEHGESVKTYYEKQSSGRYSVDGEVTDWVKVQYNEARYGRHATAIPCAGNVCTNTWNLVSDAVEPVGRRPEGRRPDRRADQGRARRVRPVGPLRLRRRRQLQRAGRLHRPLPDRALRRRPGRRRPVAGRGRDLVAPLVRLPEHRPGPGRTTRRWHPDRRHRAVGRRLHDPAGERRPQGLRPRVRPRPRPAGPLRHLGRHRLNAVELVESHGAEPAVGKPATGHRRAAPDLGAWEKLQLGWLDYEIARPVTSARSSSARTSTTRRTRRALVVVLPKKTGDHRPGDRRSRVPRPGGAAARTTWTTA